MLCGLSQTSCSLHYAMKTVQSESSKQALNTGRFVIDRGNDTQNEATCMHGESVTGLIVSRGSGLTVSVAAV